MSRLERMVKIHLKFLKNARKCKEFKYDCSGSKANLKKQSETSLAVSLKCIMMPFPFP